MDNSWEHYEPSPIEFFHARLMDKFHEWRKGKTDDINVMITGGELNNIIAETKKLTYEKYKAFNLDKAIQKEVFENTNSQERGITIIGGGDLSYEAIKRAVEVLEIKESGGKVIAVVGSRVDFSNVVEIAQKEVHESFAKSKSNIVEMLPPLIEPTLHSLERPSKRENKNKKGRNSHQYGRKPSKY